MTTKLDKKELIEKTVKFYMSLESWNEFGEFNESLREMAIQIIANEPLRLEQLFPGYKYLHPWSVLVPENGNYLPSDTEYVQGVLLEAKEMAIKELMFTENEASA